MVAFDQTTDNTSASERLNRPLRGLVSVLAGLLTLAAIGWAANIYAWLGLALYNEHARGGADPVSEKLKL